VRRAGGRGRGGGRGFVDELKGEFRVVVAVARVFGYFDVRVIIQVRKSGSCKILF
jgi:hypothetical protein